MFVGGRFKVSMFERSTQIYNYCSHTLTNMGPKMSHTLDFSPLKTLTFLYIGLPGSCRKLWHFELQNLFWSMASVKKILVRSDKNLSALPIADWRLVFFNIWYLNCQLVPIVVKTSISITLQVMAIWQIDARHQNSERAFQFNSYRHLSKLSATTPIPKLSLKIMAFLKF